MFPTDQWKRIELLFKALGQKVFEGLTNAMNTKGYAARIEFSAQDACFGG